MLRRQNNPFRRFMEAENRAGYRRQYMTPNERKLAFFQTCIWPTPAHRRDEPHTTGTFRLRSATIWQGDRARGAEEVCGRASPHPRPVACLFQCRAARILTAGWRGYPALAGVKLRPIRMARSLSGALSDSPPSAISDHPQFPPSPPPTDTPSWWDWLSNPPKPASTPP